MRSTASNGRTVLPRSLRFAILPLTLCAALAACSSGTSKSHAAATSAPGGGSGGGSAASSVSGSAAPQSADSATGLNLINPGTITAATDLTEEPTAFQQNGKYTGFAVELGREIAKRLGLKVTFKGVDFNSVISLVSTRQYDVGFLGILDTPAREKLVNFTEPIYYGFYGCVSQKSAKFNGLDSLKGKTVAVLQGSAEAAYLQQNDPQIQLKTYSDWAGSITAVLAGQVDAVLTGSSEIPTYLKQHPGLALSCTVPVPTPNGFPVPKQETTLLQNMNSVLNKIYMDGTYAKLYHQWYPGVPLPEQTLKQHPGMPK